MSESSVQHYLFTFENFSASIPFTDYSINLSSPFPLILSLGSSLLYVFLIFCVFPHPKLRAIFLKNKNFFDFFKKIHYVSLCLYSAFACLSAFYHIYSSGELFSLQLFLSNPLPRWLRMISFTFTASKIWEWLDTAIDIWKGKEVKDLQFLHCYHHATTFALFLQVCNFPGPEKSGMLLNGFVHTIMYYHYAFRLPKFMRPLITGFQIVQLAVVTSFYHITPTYVSRFANFPKEHLLEFLIPYSLVSLFTSLSYI
jgi:hypothetical protein